MTVIEETTIRLGETNNTAVKKARGNHCITLSIKTRYEKVERWHAIRLPPGVMLIPGNMGVKYATDSIVMMH